MKLKKVDPKRIKVPETRVTSYFSEEAMEAFKSSIKEAGIQQPILCTKVGEDLFLVDGLHRLQEALRLGIATVDVAIQEGEEADVYLRNLYLDHLRGKTKVSEMVNVLGLLYHLYGFDSEKIAERTGLPRDYVEKIILISEASPQVRQALDDEKIGVGHAFELARLRDHILEEELLAQLLAYHWTLKDFKEHIKNVLELRSQAPEIEATRAVRETAKVKCHYCEAELEPSQVACPITCPSCYGILFGAIKEAQREAERVASAKAEPPGAPE